MDDDKIICVDCGKEIPDGEGYGRPDGEFICDECYTMNYTTCERCGDVVSESDRVLEVHTHNGIGYEYWCDCCVERWASRCADCDEWWSNDDLEVNCFGEYICPDCAEAYVRCDDCGEPVPDGEINVIDSGCYCNNCIGRHRTIHDYHCDHEPEFHDGDGISSNCPTPGRLYLGFELEAGGMDSESACDEVADYIINYFSDGETNFHLEHDGSIPRYGFELIADPRTLESHRDFDWESVLKVERDGGLKSHDLGADACGLHVHASRDYLSETRWAFVDYLINKARPKFEDIARRRECSWARFKHADDETPLAKKVGDKYRRYDRYQAVNFKNDNTIEFRLFRGTLNPETLRATLEIVDAVVNWAKKVKMNNVLKDGGVWENFVKFVRGDEERYSNALKRFANVLN